MPSSDSQTFFPLAAALSANDIPAHTNPIDRPFFSSSLVSDLCAFAVQSSSISIRGIAFNFGKEPANSFTNDQHPDLRADYVMANPPYNIKEWWDAKLEGDARWSPKKEHVPRLSTMQTKTIHCKLANA